MNVLPKRIRIEDIRATDEDVYTIHPCYTVVHQFWDSEDGFMHRVVVQDRCRRHVVNSESGWVGYTAIAVVECRGKQFAATTQYYEGCLPPVFFIDPGIKVS